MCKKKKVTELIVTLQKEFEEKLFENFGNYRTTALELIIFSSYLMITSIEAIEETTNEISLPREYVDELSYFRQIFWKACKNIIRGYLTFFSDYKEETFFAELGIKEYEIQEGESQCH